MKITLCDICNKDIKHKIDDHLLIKEFTGNLVDRNNISYDFAFQITASAPTNIDVCAECLCQAVEQKLKSEI